MSNTVQTSIDLMSYKSVSGQEDEGAINFLAERFEKLGFENHIQTFTGDDSYDVLNIYSQKKFGEGKNLCFAGHTDVVPEGDVNSWSVNPYQPEVKEGYLIGRGAVDMKAAIAAWLVAVEEFLSENPNFDKGTLSFLITGDEEAEAINGTVKLLQFIDEKGIKIDSCIVGEPTNPSEIGEMAKVGRRGSLTCDLTVNGTQGHVAYPDVALNPCTLLTKILNEIVSLELDNGNEFFLPSNLEVTSIDVGNPTDNLIPAQAKARFNIRFNNLQTREGLKQKFHEICKKYSDNYTLEDKFSNSEPFLSEPGFLAEVVTKASEQVLGKTPELSTTGGTSDARFIRSYAEVVEFGLINKTAHKIDEKIKPEELEALKDAYKKIIELYFA